MSFIEKENEYMPAITNNEAVAITERFLAQESMVIRKVKRFKRDLQGRAMTPQDERLVNKYIKDVRVSLNKYREKFNDFMAEDDYLEVRKLMRNENHGCSAYLTLIETYVDYYTPKPLPTQSETTVRPELLSDYILYP